MVSKRRSSARILVYASDTTRLALLGNLTGLINIAFAGLNGVSLVTLVLIATRELWVAIAIAFISGYAFDTLSVRI